MEAAEKALARRFDLCTCTTKAEQETLRQFQVPTPSDWFPNGVDTPDIALLKVSVERGEYWDGSQSFLAHALTFATSMLTGKRAQFGENEKIDLGKG